MGVHHEPQVVGVRIDPFGCFVGVADETAVDEGGVAALQKQEVGVRKRSVLPFHPRR